MLRRSLETHHRFRAIAVYERTGNAYPPLDDDQRNTIDWSLLTEDAKSNHADSASPGRPDAHSTGESSGLHRARGKVDSIGFAGAGALLSRSAGPFGDASLDRSGSAAVGSGRQFLARPAACRSAPRQDFGERHRSAGRPGALPGAIRFAVVPWPQAHRRVLLPILRASHRRVVAMLRCNATRDKGFQPKLCRVVRLCE